MDKYSNKEQLFLHLDGISIVPIIYSLDKTGIIDFIVKNQEFSIEDISKHFNINQGYFNVALRSLSSVGYINIKEKNDSELLNIYIGNKEHINYFLNNKDLLNNIINLIPFYIDFEIIANNKSANNNKDFVIHLKKSIELIKRLEQDTILYFYLEGLLLGPLLSNIGFFNLTDFEYSEEVIDKHVYELISDLLLYLNYISADNQLTDKGKFFFNKCTAYGVTVSYLPTFNRIDDLLFNNKYNFIWERIDNREIHVNRSMNVWGSGGAHRTYFKEIDEIITDIFNQDITLQPKGIIDVGCGDGTFLKHLYDLIINKTIRGEHIIEHPLKIIGTDINKAARTASREKLNSYNIDNIVINGNISEPDIINKKLKNNYNEDLSNYLNTRTFLDHNRIYEEPKEILFTNIKSSGAFCYRGKLITNNLLINNLIEHLKNWKKYVNKHGIIILELHTIEPNLILNNRGSTLACAYDTTHGFSDQYLVEYPTFINCAEFAGLELVNEKSSVLPNKQRPTISINYFK